MIKKHVDNIRSNHGNILIEKNRQIDVDIELLDPPDNREQCEQTTTRKHILEGYEEQFNDMAYTQLKGRSMLCMG